MNRGRLTDSLTGSLTPSSFRRWNTDPMRTGSQQPTMRRWVVPFLAALVAVLATILSSATASAATQGVAETRVRASTAVVEVPVRPPQHIAAGQRLGNDPAAVVTVVATGVAAKSVRYGPMNPGPLDDAIANTFRSGSYTGVTASKPTTLYRVFSGNKELGSYWTRTKPSGPVQSIVDSALDPAWGNQATNWVKARVPAGTTSYEGAAASQGGLVGGGNQVFISRVDPSWVVGRGGF